MSDPNWEFAKDARGETPRASGQYYDEYTQPHQQAWGDPGPQTPWEQRVGNPGDQWTQPTVEDHRGKKPKSVAGELNKKVWQWCGVAIGIGFLLFIVMCILAMAIGFADAFLK